MGSGDPGSCRGELDRQAGHGELLLAVCSPVQTGLLTYGLRDHAMHGLPCLSCLILDTRGVCWLNSCPVCIKLSVLRCQPAW